MTFLRIFVVLFFSLAVFGSAFSDEAFDFYVEACRHSGDNPGEIATFQAELSVVTQTLFSDSERERTINGFKEQLDKKSTMTEKEKETVLASINDALSDKVNQQHVKTYTKNSAAGVGLEDDLGQTLVMDLTNKASLLTPIGEEKQMGSISQIGRTTTINADHQIQMPLHFGGRIRATQSLKLLLSGNKKGDYKITDTGIAAFKKNCEDRKRTFSLQKEKVEYEKGCFANVLEIYECGLLRERFLIDSDRDYICPKAESISPIGCPITETVSSKFILDKHSQKWFPQKVVRTGWTGTKQGEEPNFRSDTQLMPETLMINQPIPDSVFVLAAPKGMRIDDRRRDDHDQKTFFANKPGKLDLQTVDRKSLNETPWLTPKRVKQYTPPPIEEAKYTWVRIAFISAGIILIIYGLTMRFLKK